MHLTLDISFSDKTQALLTDQTLAQLLGFGAIQYHDIPLEAFIAGQFGLQAKPDLPIAAISALADGLQAQAGYWLRADPVHLVMQRDAFSLGEPMPLALSATEVNSILHTLNTHFAEDGFAFLLGQSGQWYLHTAQTPEMTTVLPAVAMQQNVHQHMPSGPDAAKWRGVINEIQMLLHSHPVNAQRELQKDLVINSVWISGGGVLPQALSALKPYYKESANCFAGNNHFYAGLALWLNLPFLRINHVSELFTKSVALPKNQTPNQHCHMHLSDPQNDDLALLLSSLKTRAIKHLTINIGFYAHTLVLNICPNAMRAFWRLAFWHRLFKRPLPLLAKYLAHFNGA
jgi:hypothetical protein